MNEALIENFEVDLSQLDDNEVIHAIEDDASLYERQAGQAISMMPIVNGLSEELSYTFYGEDFQEIQDTYTLNFTKELIKPSDLGKINEIAKELIAKHSLDTEKQVNETLYNDGALLDAIISNDLYDLEEPKSNVFTIRYECEPSEVEAATRRHVKENRDSSQLNASVEDIAIEMERFYDERELENIILQENPDGLINNIVIDYATEQGIDYEIAKQLDIYKDVDIKDVTIQLNTDFSTLAESEKERIEQIGLEEYLNKEFYGVLYYNNLFEFNVGTIVIDEDAIQEIESEM